MTIVERIFGRTVVTALSDGHMVSQWPILVEAAQDQVEETREPLSFSKPFRVDVNGYLISVGNEHILIDTGCGSGMQDSAGRLVESLAERGIAPGEIGTILLTHAHPDHVGGLSDMEGCRIFPNAQVRLAAADHTLFLEGDIPDHLPPHVRDSFQLIRAGLDPYRDHIRTFESGSNEVAPSIWQEPLPGHTPGHTGYRVRDRGEELFIWGDVVHVPEVQVSNPSVGVVFDFDAAAARKSRRQALDMAAESGVLIGGMHLRRPGFARISRVAENYRIIADV